MSFWERLFGVKRQPGKILELPSDLAANPSQWESTGEAEAWVRAHLKGWNHQDWLDLLASLRKSPYWPMNEAAIGKHLEMLQAKVLAAEVKESPTTNLDRWQSSGEPEAWVRAHPKGWNHQDWLDLLASLKRSSSYWPMNEPALGQHLEQLRDRLRTTATAAVSCRLTSAVPPNADVNEKDSQ